MKNRKKGCCGCLTALVAVFMIIGVIGSMSDNGRDVDKALSADAQTQTDNIVQASDQQEDPLLQEITAAVKEKYDDYDVRQDYSSVNVKVWDNSISDTISTIQNNGGNSNDAEWARIKNNYLDTATYIQGLLQDAGQDTRLNLSVLNNKNQNLVLLTFSDSELTYDILATDTQTSAEEPEQPEQPSQPEQASQPEQTPQPDHSAGAQGNENNFNTYNNLEQQKTTASYVLNTSTKKYHFPSCSAVKKIAPENYATSNSSPAELASQGYSACGRCKP